MKKYYSVFRIKLIYGLQYRMAAVAGVATQFFWGIMYIMIYEAFYSNSHTNLPMELNQLITYIWLQQGLLHLFVLWISDREILDNIEKGNISYELLRPFNLYSLWYCKILSKRVSGVLLRFFPLIAITFLLPEKYHISLPVSIESFIVFLVSMFLGVLVIVSINMFICIVTMVTFSYKGVASVFTSVGEFFAGLIIPIPLMPAIFRNITYKLPFWVASDLPFRIYTGHIDLNQASTFIMGELFWLIVLVITGRLFLKKMLKKLVVQGG